VGRITISFTSTLGLAARSRTLMARAMRRGRESPSFSILSISWDLTSRICHGGGKVRVTNPGEMLVTRSLSPASCRKVSVILRTAFFVPE